MQSAAVRRAQVVAGVVVAVVAVALATLSVTRPTPEPPSAFRPPAPPTLAERMAEFPERPRLAQVAARLADRKRPFTMAVLGDSTGADRIAWPRLLGRELGTRFDRPVTLHPWIEGTDVGPVEAYFPPESLAKGGTGAPVTIWNGSAPGRGPEYSAAKIDQFIPTKTVDLILINHGHNVPKGTGSEKILRLAKAVEKRWPDAVVANIIQNPELEPSGHKLEQENEVYAMAEVMSNLGYANISVRDAFLRAGDYRPLMQDFVHPNAAGYECWNGVVVAALLKRDSAAIIYPWDESRRPPEDRLIGVTENMSGVE